MQTPTRWIYATAYIRIYPASSQPVPSPRDVKPERAEAQSSGLVARPSASSRDLKTTTARRKQLAPVVRVSRCRDTLILEAGDSQSLWPAQWNSNLAEGLKSAISHRVVSRHSEAGPKEHRELRREARL